MVKFEIGKEYKLIMSCQTNTYQLQKRTKCFLYFMIIDCSATSSLYHIEKFKIKYDENGNEYIKGGEDYIMRP